MLFLVVIFVAALQTALWHRFPLRAIRPDNSGLGAQASLVRPNGGFDVRRAHASCERSGLRCLNLSRKLFTTCCYVATALIFTGFFAQRRQGAVWHWRSLDRAAVRFRRQQARPLGYEVLQDIATGGRGFAYALGAAADVEGLKQEGQCLSCDGAFAIPRPVGLGVQPVEQGGGGDAFGIAVVGKGVAQIGEQPDAVPAVMGQLLFEESGQSFTGFHRPRSADLGCDLEQRLDHVQAARAQAGWKLLGRERIGLVQCLEVLLCPFEQCLDYRLGFFESAVQVQSLDLVEAGDGFEDDGDGAVRQHFRQGSDSGEGLGTEETTFTLAASVARTAGEAADQQSAESWVFGARAGADGGLEFVEQQRGDGRIDSAGEGGGGESGAEGRLSTQPAEQLQAESLARLLVIGADGEIGSDLSRRKTVGMENPESEDGALVLGAVEITADELDDVLEQLRAVDRWARVRFGG